MHVDDGGGGDDDDGGGGDDDDGESYAIHSNHFTLLDVRWAFMQNWHKVPT